MNMKKMKEKVCRHHFVKIAEESIFNYSIIKPEGKRIWILCENCGKIVMNIDKYQRYE